MARVYLNQKTQVQPQAQPKTNFGNGRVYLNNRQVQPVQNQVPQQKGIDWGAIGKGALDVGKNLIEAPLKIPMKATASILEPISGVTNIPFAGNTYQQDARENAQNLKMTQPNASMLKKIEVGLGSVAQPILDIASLAYGGGSGKEAQTGANALWKSIKTGGAIGGGYGGVQSMQQGKTLPETIKNTAKNAVIGGVVGGGLHGLLSSIGKYGQRGSQSETTPIKQPIQDIQSGKSVPGQELPLKISSYTQNLAQTKENVNPLIQEAEKTKVFEGAVNGEHGSFSPTGDRIQVGNLNDSSTILHEVMHKNYGKLSQEQQGVLDYAFNEFNDKYPGAFSTIYGNPEENLARAMEEYPVLRKQFGGDFNNKLSGVQNGRELISFFKQNIDETANNVQRVSKQDRFNAINQSKGLQEAGKTTNENPSTQGDPIQKITEAIKNAKPMERQQAKLYSEERARRVARIVGVGKNVQGEAGFHAQLGQLKGELPKVQFEGVRTQLGQGDIDHLFNTVEQSKILTPFEKITAKSGLAKLIGQEGGQIPTKGELSLMSEVFPKELIDSVLEKRSKGQILLDKAGEVLNVPRSLMASFDVSAPLRQGAFLIGRPKQWFPAFTEMFKNFASEKSYQSSLENIQSRPTYGLMRESKLALTDMSKGITGREEQFMSNLAEKIPGIGKVVRASDRAYTGFLNKLRSDVFDDLVSKLGKDEAGDIARFVNSATGRGELPQILNSSSALLNGAFFSPRLMASRINLLNPQYYVSLSPAVRMEAIKSLLSFGGTVATVLGLAKLNGANVGTDPRSSDFGKIKVGDTRYDIFGGFQQYAVFASRMITGQYVSSTTGKQMTLGDGYLTPTRGDIISRFLQSKESPVLGYAAGLITGKDQMGDKFNLPAEAINRFIPMFTSDVNDLMAQGQNPAMALPGALGVGVQTYTDQVPVLSQTKLGKPNIQWNPYPSVGEKVMNYMTGTNLSQIPQNQWQGLTEEKNAETQRNIQMDAVKQRVLSSGKPENYDGSFVYLKDGIVTTKKIGNQSRTPLKDKLLYQAIQQKKSKPYYTP